MKTYLHHLLADIETVIRERWYKCPPHFWQHGIEDPFLIPPEALNKEEALELRKTIQLKERIVNSASEASFKVMEDYVSGKTGLSMVDQFGFQPEAFPPPEKLTEVHLDPLVHSIRRLWATFNFTAVIPENVPSGIQYPLLLKHMTKPAGALSFWSGVL
jgi:hypothetical protein